MLRQALSSVAIAGALVASAAQAQTNYTAPPPSAHAVNLGALYEPAQQGRGVALYAAPAQQYAPPAQQQYAPPAQQYAAPAQQYAPPAQQQYAPPAQQQYAPQTAQQYAPPATPIYTPPATQQYAPPATSYDTQAYQQAPTQAPPVYTFPTQPSGGYVGHTQDLGGAQYGYPPEQGYAAYGQQQQYGGGAPTIEQPTVGYAPAQPAQPAQPVQPAQPQAAPQATYGAAGTGGSVVIAPFYVQTNSFTRRDYAERERDRLLNAGVNAFITQATVGGVNRNRVRVAANSRAEARQIRDRLRGMGFENSQVHNR